MTKDQIKVLELKNYQLDKIVSWLDVPMHGQQARSKVRFLRLLTPLLQDLDKGKTAIVEKYVDKDDKGVYKTKADKPNEYDFKDQEAADKEYAELLKDDARLDILPSNKQDIINIKEALADTSVRFDTEDAFIYDEVMTALEAI